MTLQLRNPHAELCGRGCRWRTTSTAENITSALLAHHPRDYAQMNDMLRGHYTKDAHYYVHTDPWYTTRWRLDFAGSFSIWVGAVLYNVSCFSGAFEVRCPHVHTHPFGAPLASSVRHCVRCMCSLAWMWGACSHAQG